MYYIIYKITNKINHKIYIGKHQTKNLNDNYMGSGKRLRDAIKHYGIENFEKEILFQFDNELDMNNKEAELVTQQFVKEDSNYNMCPGGNGGFGYINNSGISKMLGKNHSEKTKDILSELLIERHKNGTAPKMTEEVRKNISKAKLGTKYKSKPPKSEDHRKKISDAIRKKWQEKKQCG